MKKYVCVAALCLFPTFSSVVAEEQEFTIDPLHSSLTFTIRHLYTLFTGRFNTFSGTVRMDPDKPDSLSIEAEVDMLSIDTANAARDKHLRAPDFFHTADFAKAHFKSTDVRSEEDGTLTIKGNMTIRGITKGLPVRCRFLGYGPDHRGGRRAGLQFSTTIRRSEFGVTYNATLPGGTTILGEEVELTFDVEAIEAVRSGEGTLRKTPETLSDRMEKLKANRKTPLPPDVTEALDKAAAEIREKGGIDGLETGAKAPDFTLPDAEGNAVSLSDTLKKGPAVVVFYRGEWCSFCNVQLKALEEVLPQMKNLGATLIGISPQKPSASLILQKNNKLSFPLLADTDGKTTRDYRLLYAFPEEMKKVYLERFKIDLAKYNDEGRWELPATATYVIDTNGVITAGLVDLDYTKRMEPADILEALQELAK